MTMTMVCQKTAARSYITLRTDTALIFNRLAEATQEDNLDAHSTSLQLAAVAAGTGHCEAK